MKHTYWTEFLKETILSLFSNSSKSLEEEEEEKENVEEHVFTNKVVTVVNKSPENNKLSIWDGAYSIDVHLHEECTIRDGDEPKNVASGSTIKLIDYYFLTTTRCLNWDLPTQLCLEVKEYELVNSVSMEIVDTCKNVNFDCEVNALVNTMSTSVIEARLFKAQQLSQTFSHAFMFTDQHPLQLNDCLISFSQKNALENISEWKNLQNQQDNSQDPPFQLKLTTGKLSHFTTSNEIQSPDYRYDEDGQPPQVTEIDDDMDFHYSKESNESNESKNSEKGDPDENLQMKKMRFLKDDHLEHIHETQASEEEDTSSKQIQSIDKEDSRRKQNLLLYACEFDTQGMVDSEIQNTERMEEEEEESDALLSHEEETKIDLSYPTTSKHPPFCNSTIKKSCVKKQKLRKKKKDPVFQYFTQLARTKPILINRASWIE